MGVEAADSDVKPTKYTIITNILNISRIIRSPCVHGPIKLTHDITEINGDLLEDFGNNRFAKYQLGGHRFWQ